MATAVFKQVRFPLLESITTPPPNAPDPYQNVRFGLFNDGSGLKLYICNDGINWTVATLQEQIDNVPEFFLNPSDNFFSHTDALGNLSDLRFLTREVLQLEISGISLFEGTDFEKDFSEDTVTMLGGNSLLPNSDYLVTINQ